MAEAKELKDQPKEQPSRVKQYDPHAPKLAATAAKVKQHPNAHLEDALRPFDYKKMRDKMMSAYLDLTEGPVQNPTHRVRLRYRSNGMDATQKLQFDVYHIQPYFQPANPDVDNSPLIFAGFDLVKDAPLKTTLTTLRDAILLNQQCHSSKSADGASPRYIYYLLQKPQ